MPQDLPLWLALCYSQIEVSHRRRIVTRLVERIECRIACYARHLRFGGIGRSCKLHQIFQFALTIVNHLRPDAIHRCPVFKFQIYEELLLGIVLLFCYRPCHHIVKSIYLLGSCRLIPLLLDFDSSLGIIFPLGGFFIIIYCWLYGIDQKGSFRTSMRYLRQNRL